MGYWENTTYLRHGQASAVADAIAALLAREGMQRVARPSQRAPGQLDPMQYGRALQNNLWGVAVIPGKGAPGNSAWSIVKTAPLELLGERAAGADRMRLMALAERLGVYGFQINVYDGSEAVLVETDGQGRCLLSGF